MEARPHHYHARYRHDLSPQQERVLRLIAEGKTNAEIAIELTVTLDGAKWHVREILAKLHVDSREDAAAWWREYSSVRSRAARRIHVIAAAGIWKTSAAAVAVGLALSTAAFLAFAFRSGEGETAVAPTDECVLGDLRWELAVTPVPGGSQATLSVSLRDEEWYEGVFDVLGLGRGPVASPCRISGAISVEFHRVGDLIERPREKPGPPAFERIPGILGNPGSLPLDLQLKTGGRVPVLAAELSNWCAEGTKLVLDAVFPAVMPGGPPATGVNITTGLPESPSCVEPSSSARLRVGAP